MTRSRVGAAALAALSLLLTSCSGLAQVTGEPGASPPTAHVAVDTPQLAELRVRAGLDPCVAGTAAPVTGGLPSIKLPCVGGGPSVDLSSLRGPMVISMFASWCTYCPGEMPYFERLKSE